MFHKNLNAISKCVFLKIFKKTNVHSFPKIIQCKIGMYIIHPNLISRYFNKYILENLENYVTSGDPFTYKIVFIINIVVKDKYIFCLCKTYKVDLIMNILMPNRFTCILFWSYWPKQSYGNTMHYTEKFQEYPHLFLKAIASELNTVKLGEPYLDILLLFYITVDWFLSPILPYPNTNLKIHVG